MDLGIATPQRAQEIATKAKDNPKSLEGVSLDGAQFSACPIGITAAAGAIAAASWYASTVYNGDNSMNGFVALMMALPIGGVILAGTCVD